jgi:hypothetical protein
MQDSLLDDLGQPVPAWGPVTIDCLLITGLSELFPFEYILDSCEDDETLSTVLVYEKTCSEISCNIDFTSLSEFIRCPSI